MPSFSVTPAQIAAFDAESLALGYAEVLDRNDARRILVWLSELDPVTGVDPVAEKKKADEAAAAAGSRAGTHAHSAAAAARRCA